MSIVEVMPRSKYRRWVTLAVSALVAVGLFLAFWPVRDRPAPRYISVAFGITNDPAGREPPFFSVSNASTFNLHCRNIGSQIQMTNRSKGITNIVWTWQSWNSMVLQPGQSTNSRAQPPTNSVPWRFAVFVERPPNAVQRALAKIEDHLPRRIFWLLYGDPRRTQFFTSRVFRPQEIANDHGP